MPEGYVRRIVDECDTEGAVARLAELAGDGPVLELGPEHLGPHGLELDVPGPFAVVALAAGALFSLPDQDAQVRCFADAARRLASGGRFVVEAWIPQLDRFTAGSAVTVGTLGGDRVSLEIARLDPVAQRMETTEVRLREGDVRLHPASYRYAWPSELDLMARLAGMALEARHEDWRQTPFTAHSASHVSVYRKP